MPLTPAKRKGIGELVLDQAFIVHELELSVSSVVWLGVAADSRIHHAKCWGCFVHLFGRHWGRVSRCLDSLQKLSVPDAVSKIDPMAFIGSDNLESLNVSSSNSTTASLDEILFNRAKTEIMRFPQGKQEMRGSWQ